MKNCPLLFMENILTRLFNKRGIKDATELSIEERVDFNRWQAVLSKEELTMEDIKHFCGTQIEIIEGKWSNLDTEEKRKAEMIPYHTVYRTLLKVIDSPKVAREMLEKQLNLLIQ